MSKVHQSECSLGSRLKRDPFSTQFGIGPLSKKSRRVHARGGLGKTIDRKPLSTPKFLQLQSCSIDKLRAHYKTPAVDVPDLNSDVVNPRTMGTITKSHYVGVVMDEDFQAACKISNPVWDSIQEEIIEQCLVLFVYPHQVRKYWTLPDWDKISAFLQVWSDEVQALAAFTET